MMNIEKNEPFFTVYGFLPSRLCDVLRLFALKNPSLVPLVTEIRLRTNGSFSLTLPDENLTVSPLGDARGGGLICTKSDIDECVRLLCSNSYQSHENEIESGYISAPRGLRAGVACSASPGGNAHTVNSVCIRIPHEVKADVSSLFSSGILSTLIFSPPAEGKTTVLRLCISHLSSLGYRIAVIDTRYELSVSPPPPLADYICGKGRGQGIEIATRVLNPQVIVCDEIGSQEETEAILSVQNTGVPFIATAHGSSLEAILRRPTIARLASHGVFERFIRLKRAGDEFSYEITQNK